MSQQVGSTSTGSSYQTASQATGQSASLAIVEAVAAATETAPEELPQLTDAVDPDALDALFAGRQTNGRVTFQYAGYCVSVSADQTVTVDPSGNRHA
ncbi:MAG: HalOD1 output domain-containing protein [Haloarcula sp.]